MDARVLFATCRHRGSSSPACTFLRGSSDSLPTCRQHRRPRYRAAWLYQNQHQHCTRSDRGATVLVPAELGGSRRRWAASFHVPCSRPEPDQTRDRFQGNPHPAPLPALASSGRAAHGATSLLSPADTAPGTGTGTGTPARLSQSSTLINVNQSPSPLLFGSLPFRRKGEQRGAALFILGAFFLLKSLSPYLQ